MSNVTCYKNKMVSGAGTFKLTTADLYPTMNPKISYINKGGHCNAATYMLIQC